MIDDYSLVNFTTLDIQVCQFVSILSSDTLIAFEF